MPQRRQTAGPLKLATPQPSTSFTGERSHLALSTGSVESRDVHLLPELGTQLETFNDWRGPSVLEELSRLRFTGHADRLTATTYSPALGRPVIAVCDLGGRLLHEIPARTPTEVGISPGHEAMVIVRSGQSLEVSRVHPTTLEPVWSTTISSVILQPEEEQRCIQFTPDCTRVLVSVRSFPDPSVHVLDLVTGHTRSVITGALAGSASINVDGDQILLRGRSPSTGDPGYAVHRLSTSEQSWLPITITPPKPPSAEPAYPITLGWAGSDEVMLYSRRGVTLTLTAFHRHTEHIRPVATIRLPKGTDMLDLQIAPGASWPGTDTPSVAVEPIPNTSPTTSASHSSPVVQAAWHTACEAILAYDYPRAVTAWAHAVALEYPPGHPITVTPDAFGPYPGPLDMLLHEDNIVTGPDRGGIGNAIRAAQPRFERVTPDGDELTDDEIGDDVAAREVNLTGPDDHPNGLQFVLEAEYWPRTHITCLRILAQELRSRNLDAMIEPNHKGRHE